MRLSPTGTTLSAIAAAALLITALSACEFRPAASALSRQAFENPGRLASLPDNRRLNLRCLGHGSPTVILESGFGAGAAAWSAVQPRVAQLTRVCAYDRAGYGFSDPGPTPRDGAAIARDLDYGLKAAGIGGPYVVVGHSAGGLYARLFAARQPKEVVGMVFVDSSVEHQTQRMQAIFGPGAGTLEGVKRRPLRCLNLTSAAKTVANDPALLECVQASADPHTRQVELRPGIWRAEVSELDNLFTTTSDEVDRTVGILKDIPVIVLTAGKADGVAAGSDDPGARVWQALHRQLAGRFLHGDQRFVKSSHLMMKDRPEVVADATIEFVQAARNR
jgi:pimeloyl-ACP methyl ester carboxylesterase